MANEHLTPEARAALENGGISTTFQAVPQPSSLGDIVSRFVDDPELKVLAACVDLFKQLDREGRARVSEYLMDRFHGCES